MWLFEGRPVTEADHAGMVAFVYLIERIDTGKRYIGKKRLIKKTSKKPLKGKKRKRVSYGESDWRDYFGSNDELKRDVAELGPENFTREVLVFCKTLGASSYVEARYQFLTDCICDITYYNAWISVRTRVEHLKGIDHEDVRRGAERLMRPRVVA